MVGLDARRERALTSFATATARALGEELIALALYGSGAGEDWLPARSDVNTAIVTRRLTPGVLDTLGASLRELPPGFAVPLVLDEEYLARARDVFPMEFDDLRRQHRLLAGKDVMATITVDRAALRRQCEHEARAKLLRLRTLYLTAPRQAALEGSILGSLKSFLVVLRHLVRLRGDEPGTTYRQALTAGETCVGPLPQMRALLDHREGTPSLAPEAVRAGLARYLGDVERIVAAVDALDA